jgi:hypothetical protein
LFNLDAHAIGTQYVSDWVIDGVEMDHTCSCVEMWTDTPPVLVQQNNTVKNCAIHDTSESGAITNRAGITIYSGTCYVHNNTLWNIEGTGISTPTSDDAVVENNSIYNTDTAGVGWWGARGALSFGNGTCRNNIIQSCRYFIQLKTGAAPTTIDYNLYIGDGYSADFYSNFTSRTFTQWQTDLGWDTHSLNAVNPGWRSSPPSSQTDFHLTSGSPAIHSGVATGYPDPDGVIMVGSMGAYEYVGRGATHFASITEIVVF